MTNRKQERARSLPPGLPGRPNIVLVGFMGTGKTTVGRKLSERFGMPLVDMDRVIEEREGREISRIFAESGEPEFRRLERALVRELAAGSGRVIATGGGIVLDPDNVADFRRGGLVVCLQADVRRILARVRDESHRPLLEGGEKARRIRELLEARRALYAAVPNQVDTTAMGPDEVAGVIGAMYEEERRTRRMEST